MATTLSQMPGPKGYPGPYASPGMAPVLADYDTNFYVGPLGGLRALPGTASKVDTPLSVLGGTHISLTGSLTRDVFGYKRAWVFDYPGLTRTEALYVEALQRNLVAGPLYLIDPRRPNRLPEQIASGGSLLGSPQGFIGSNTTIVSWKPLSATGTTLDTLPAAPLLRGAIDWQLLTPGAASLELGGLAPDGRHNIPVMPGEVLSVSLWAAGPPGTQLGGTVTAFDAGGNTKAGAVLPTTTLTADGWTRVAVSFTAPVDSAYLRLTLSAPGGTAAGAIYLTALQVAPFNPSTPPHLREACPYPDYGGGWSTGGGAPQVVPDVGSSSYLLPGLQSMALTLTER